MGSVPDSALEKLPKGAALALSNETRARTTPRNTPPKMRKDARARAASVLGATPFSSTLRLKFKGKARKRFNIFE